MLNIVMSPRMPVKRPISVSLLNCELRDESRVSALQEVDPRFQNCVVQSPKLLLLASAAAQHNARNSQGFTIRGVYIAAGWTDDLSCMPRLRQLRWVIDHGKIAALFRHHLPEFFEGPPRVDDLGRHPAPRGNIRHFVAQ